MSMNMTTVILIEGYDDVALFSGFGRLYYSFVFVMVRCTCISCEIMLPVPSSEQENVKYLLYSISFQPPTTACFYLHSKGPSTSGHQA